MAPNLAASQRNLIHDMIISKSLTTQQICWCELEHGPEQVSKYRLLVIQRLLRRRSGGRYN